MTTDNRRDAEEVFAAFERVLRDAGRVAYSPRDPLCDGDDGHPLYLAEDGRTVYTLNEKGERVEVGEVDGRTPNGVTVRLRGSITGVTVAGRVSG